MEEDKSMDNIIKFRKNLKEVFKGEQGKQVLKFLEECYVDASAVDTTPELTYYRLGQKELIQNLIKETQENIDDR